MNVRAGDIAIVIGSSEYAGLIVDVLCLAPTRPFSLPDGYWHVACTGQEWVIKAQRPIKCPAGTGYQMSIYATASDRWLRPIRGEPETVEKHEEITA